MLIIHQTTTNPKLPIGYFFLHVVQLLDGIVDADGSLLQVGLLDSYYSTARQRFSVAAAARR